jgi:hypothetical protein
VAYHLRSNKRSSSCKSSKKRNRTLRYESLESREMLSGLSLSTWWSQPVMVGAVRVANAAPKVVQPLTINNNAAIIGKTATLSILGSDDGGESKLRYTWSVTTKPSGGSVSFNVNGTNAAKNSLATFTKAGTYNINVTITDAGGLSVNCTKSVVVSPRLTSFNIYTGNGQLVNPNSTLTVSGTSQSLVAQGLDQFGYAMSSQPSFRWTTTAIPAGATAPTLSANGANANITFRKVGAYGLRVQATVGTVSLTSNLSMNVTQALTSIQNTSTTPVNVTGKSLQLAAPKFIDQFGNAFTTPPALTWSTATLPSGAPAPSFTTNAGVTTATFGKAGYYIVSARAVNYPTVSIAIAVNVTQTLTSIAVSPNTTSLYQGTTQQFVAQGFDQFQRQMTSPPTCTWSTSGGTISATGLLTAPGSAGSCTVTARSGSVSGAATVTVLASQGTYKNAALGNLVQSLYVDGSINRQDMIQILRSVGGDGVVDAWEFSDLKTVLNQAGSLNIPGYVQVLAGDVINGNVANAIYQGTTLGNLAAGSSAAQLNKLIDKWFLGADHPTICNTSATYKSVAGSLFSRTPSHTDEYQGQLGDCYFISALGTLADSNPAAVQNMFIDNGDGTFAVRFYTGTYGTIYNYNDGSISAGFTNNVGTADYITVDRMLPVSSTGILVYANYGANYTNTANTLWIALAEKAYAQWNETGKEGRDGLNAYASIQGGWMATVDAQVLGYNATDYIMTNTNKQVAIDALAAHKAVTIGTLQWSGTKYGLYATHAYAIVGYNPSTDMFTLYNPWGSNQPGPLSWSQLQATCSQLAVAGTSGTVPFVGLVVNGQTVKASANEHVADIAADTTISELPDKAASLSDIAPTISRHIQLSTVTNASDKLFENLEKDWALRSKTRIDDVHALLPASFVDATFALESLLSHRDYSPAFA